MVENINPKKSNMNEMRPGIKITKIRVNVADIELAPYPLHHFWLKNEIKPIIAKTTKEINKAMNTYEKCLDIIKELYDSYKQKL